jgi:hypothetical protein
MQYRRKPLFITAEQFDGNTFPKGVKIHKGNGKPFVSTIHNQIVYIEKGDFIVPEPDGTHFYPIKENIFKDSYDMVWD